MDYKATLNLPKTDFPMKAELPKREPGFLKRWDAEGIYGCLTAQNKAKPRFILHDGPPYANGNIHFGHILNKILKDIIVKYKNMAGFYSPYVPGWDCHGLPIELGAVKELKEAAAKMGDSAQVPTPLEIRAACREYANRFVAAQSAEFRRLGIFGDWEHPYLTLSNGYEADIAREFAKLYFDGFVYRGKKPVHWCTSCRTALAEAEVEYENETSPSIYVKFKITNSEKLAIASDRLAGRPVYFVIWTTTPWTLPANLGLALGEKFEYVALGCGDEVYIVAQELKETFLKAIHFSGEADELKILTGEELVSLQLNADHPFLKRSSKVVLGDHVTVEGGTGIVHIAPGHGQEDYQVGLANKLEILCPIDAGGKIMAGALKEARFDEIVSWEGLFVKAANKKIVEFLSREKILLNSPTDSITHSYPHCWRCKNPIIFRATEQWFLSLEHHDLRKQTLRAINGDVQWIPSWGHDRIFGMIEARPDWCLSRQRIWGVPIIIHFCKKCEEPHLTPESSSFICDRFEKEGADAWWKGSESLLPPGTKCACGGTEFTKESSILDVWFDSGVSHAAVLEKNPDLSSPADLYLEGSDQHRGWFHSSLLTSMATRKRPPYKAVLTHGFVVDGEGKKYSKSAKNYLPPEKMLNEMGAELFRLWVAAEDYRNDIRVSTEIVKVLAEIYRKIRNTCRFILGNLYDFNPKTDSVPFEKRTELDRYALHRVAQVIQKAQSSYENYEFHAVHHALNKYFTVELSATYLDILKDRLYCDRADGFLRRSAQSTQYEILVSVLPLMAPILSFTSEEIWGLIPNRSDPAPSVFLAAWPKVPAEWTNRDLEAKWDRVWMVRQEALKALELARQKKEIGHPLDAKVQFAAEGETLSFLKSFESEWAQICITSQAQIVDSLPTPQLQSAAVPSLKVSVVKADGEKCERCWNYSVEVGTIAEHPKLCGRCAKAVG